MELKQYLSIVMRWLWLLVLGALLGGAGGYYASSLEVPVYQASTRAMVMRAPLEQSSDLTYYSDMQLVQTYMQLLSTEPVLQAASARLGFEVKKSQLTIKQNQDTQIISLTVEDTDPARAAEIANVLIGVLIEHNTSLQSGRYASTEESIRAQISQVEMQINSIEASLDEISSRSFQDQLSQVENQIRPLQDEVSILEQEIAALSPARTISQKTQVAEKEARIAQIQPLLDLYREIYSNLVVLGKPVDLGADNGSRVTRLQSTLELYQQLYLNLLNSLETIRLARLQNTPDIVQIEVAARPLEPIRPRPLTNTLLGGVVGLMLAAGIVFLVEYLDDTLKTPQDVERALGLPVLGFVAQVRHGRGKETLVVTHQPRSPVAEAFRALRTNIEFASVEKPIRTLLVTSPGPSEGKTTVAANLAAVLSYTNKRVILLDADMRRPRLHELLGTHNRYGLSSLFLDRDQSGSITQARKELPNLWTITSGSPPPNPAELLGSAKMERILDELKKRVDLIVIDSPPSLVADAQILAGRVDAVLLVIEPGKTRTETARACLESLKRSGGRIVGVVLNRIPRNRSYYYGGYRYYASRAENKGYYSTKPAAVPVMQQAAPAREGVPPRIVLNPALISSPSRGTGEQKAEPGATPARPHSRRGPFEDLQVEPNLSHRPRPQRPDADPSRA